MHWHQSAAQRWTEGGLTEWVDVKYGEIVNPHRGCRYSDSPFARKDTFLYCRVQKWVGRGWHPGHGDAKRKLYLRKTHFFVIEKYIEDVKQEEKHVPDLLESIMRPPGLVKEELRPISCKIIQIRSKIKEFRASTFWIPETRCFPAGGQNQPAHQEVLSNIWPR